MIKYSIGVCMDDANEIEEELKDGNIVKLTKIGAEVMMVARPVGDNDSDPLLLVEGSFISFLKAVWRCGWNSGNVTFGWPKNLEVVEG